jgi:RNA-directed DNA polymerase
MENSLCEKPERHASRRLSDHLVLEGRKQKVHSLVEKVYSRKNLKLAWERVRANQGASGADKVTIEEFETRLDENLEWLHQELRENTYQPQAVRRLEIPKRGAPGKTRPLGIPSVYDRVCQQALVNRLEPIFERVFDPSSFVYRKGRKRSAASPPRRPTTAECEIASQKAGLVSQPSYKSELRLVRTPRPLDQATSPS